MIKNGILIKDHFAEAFDMKACRLIVTADSLVWARAAAIEMTGFATSVIACGCEAGIEAELSKDETLDGRVGISVLLFAMSWDGLKKHAVNRSGQCVMTAPSSALFSGFDEDPSHKDGMKIPLGSVLRYFGDGWQRSKLLGGRRYWRVPVMEGEFLCSDHSWGMGAIGGGNFLIEAVDRASALRAAEKAVQAAAGAGIIMPFPGGVVRSGSKVGSKYKDMIASTNQAHCPLLRGVVTTTFADEVGSVLEIVINGIDFESISQAMRRGIEAVCSLGKRGGIIAIDAGNYGGKLGRHHFHLRKILA